MYYLPVDGRWLSRDPIEERGGKNLAAFCENDSLNRVDVIGRKPRGTVGCKETGGIELDRAHPNPRNCCCGRRDKRNVAMYDSHKCCCCRKTFTVWEKVDSRSLIWKGSCKYFGAGLGFGGAVIWCELMSDLNEDCKMWKIKTRAKFVGASLGFGAYGFPATFTGASAPSAFNGAARWASIGASVGIGGSVSDLHMGTARLKGKAGGMVGGATPGAEVLGGTSAVTEVEELPLKECDKWR